MFECDPDMGSGGAGFVCHGSGRHLLLRPAEFLLVLRKPTVEPDNASPLLAAGKSRSGTQRPREATALRMRLVGASPGAVALGEQQLPGKVNRFLGQDPAAWRTNLPLYGRVRYQAVYRGVDLVYYGNQQRLEYDFELAPGVAPEVVRLSFDGVSQVELNGEGDLVLHTAGGPVLQHKPLAYQDRNGTREIINSAYVITDHNQVGFRVAAYDRTRPLVIDPVLSYASYFGGTGIDVAWDIAVDAAGSAYIVGETESVTFTGFATTNAFQTNYGGGYLIGGDAFVAKLNPTGSAAEYFTYLGGSGIDGIYGVAVDGAGNAYVGGFTTSSNFPALSTALQPNIAGLTNANSDHYPPDGFVVKLDPTGSRLAYSTYLGGPSNDMVIAIAVDTYGQALVTGRTDSTNFTGITTTSLQPNYGGGTADGFIAKLNATGTALLYATYFGGSDTDYGQGIAADAQGCALVTGLARSTNLMVTNALWAANAGGFDAFVAKLNPEGTSLAYATYLGGVGDDYSLRVAVDSHGNPVIAGQSYSHNFPTTNAWQATNAGIDDVFVAKVSATGSQLLFATYLGGTLGDAAWGLALDRDDNIFLTGQTSSPGFPGVTTNSIGSTNRSTDAFVAELSADGSALLYATYVGGSADDLAYGIAVDAAGSAYVAGKTYSTDLLSTNAIQSSLAGQSDAWVAKLVNPHTVTAQQVGDQVMIAWPAPLPEFRLQSTEALGLGNTWTFDPTPVTIISGRNTCTVPLNSAARIYRLVLDR